MHSARIDWGKREDIALVDVVACPLCGSRRHGEENTPPANLYSEQLALILGCEEMQLLAQVRNRCCADCGLWHKSRWFRPELLGTLFLERVPDHPKGWDAISDRFSERGFVREVGNYRHALASGISTECARYRRTLMSIVDSITLIDAEGMRASLQHAIEAADVDGLDALLPALNGHFTEPAAFKRFSGFSAPSLWDWMQSHLGAIHCYGEVGCPLWGQLARTDRVGVQRQYFRRRENNYWGDSCRRNGQHCSERLAACSGIAVQPWPPADGIRLDALGVFQYLDHLEAPNAFATEAFARARAMLLVLDALDAPLAIQHFTGWDGATVSRLAWMHGKQVADDFLTIHASGNRAWLLY